MKERIIMVVFILILGSVLTTALVVVDNFTAPKIKANEEKKLQVNLMKIFDIPFNEKDENSIKQTFTENVEVVEKNDLTYYKSKGNDIAFKIAGPGAFGPLAGAMAVTSDLERLKGVTILSNSETPGLGTRIFEEEYLKNYKGKKIVPEIKVLAGGGASNENEVDGITGATLTCVAFQNLINSEFKRVKPIISESE